MIALVFGIALIVIGLVMITSLPITGVTIGSMGVIGGAVWILIWWKERRDSEQE